MSYYNTGAPPVNVPPPQGYGEVFSMLIYQLCILRFDFAFQLLPVCLISAVHSLMRAAPLFFNVRNVFPSVRTALFCPRNVLSEHGSLCFFEWSCQFACVHRMLLTVTLSSGHARVMPGWPCISLSFCSDRLTAVILNMITIPRKWVTTSTHYRKLWTPQNPPLKSLTGKLKLDELPLR